MINMSKHFFYYMITSFRYRNYYIRRSIVFKYFFNLYIFSRNSSSINYYTLI